MRKNICIIQLMLLMTLMICLSGCSFKSESVDESDGTKAGNEEISDSNESETVTTGSETEIVTYRDTSSVYESPTELLDSDGSLSQGFNWWYSQNDLLVTDDYGAVYTYSGGEMEMKMHINASRTEADNGIGILLFLDGEPQPYRVEGGDGDGNEDYAYLHIFYQEEEEDAVYDFCFIPVAGENGDTLELYAANINNPDYRLSASISGHYQTGGSIVSSVRLKFEADPGETAIPSITDRNVVCNISYEDLTDEDIEGISSSDLSYEIYSNFYAEGILVESTMYFYGTTEEDTIHLRYETFGTTADTYGLIFYLDHEPLLVDGEVILIEIQSGKKTVVELEFDMTGFDGGSVLYAARIPRNYKTLSLDGTVGESGWPSISNTIYLTSATSRDELQ